MEERTGGFCSSTGTETQSPVALSNTGEAVALMPAYMEIGCAEADQMFGGTDLSSQSVHIKPTNGVHALSYPMCHIVQVNWVPEDSGNATSSQIVWEEDTTQNSRVAAGAELEDNVSPPRARKRKRPFSPELIGNGTPNRKNNGKSKIKKRDGKHNSRVSQENEVTSFSCDKCHTSCIIDPARCRVPASQLRKQPSRRRKLDPVTKKMLNLCNACGIALSRPPKKQKKVVSTEEDRTRYLEEAASFAKDIALRVQNTAAERLYCPSFKSRPCGCIQAYLTCPGETPNTLETRVEDLLSLLKTACELGRKKNIYPEALEQPEGANNTTTVERKQRLRELERFILETRQYLRDKLHFCERACQRILLYSNNFLHKRLKSTPDQGSRISRQLGRNSSGQLKSIQELGSISCCSESCSRLALSHSTLLEEWRRKASEGQRQARRVLAEMLTPSGGTKANCYKFIAMVTGCGPSTISSVSHQMRITKGDREPPEHGLKRWYRENPRNKAICSGPCVASSDRVQSDTLLSKFQGASSEDFNLAEDTDLTQKLQERRKQLEEEKQRLLLKQQELDEQQQLIDQQLRIRTEQTLQDTPSSTQVTAVVPPSNDVENRNTSISSMVGVPMEAKLSLIADGQSLQLLDIMPGTYLAVPAGYSNPSILRMTAEPKESVHSSEVLNSNEVYNGHAATPSSIFEAKNNMGGVDDIARENCPTTMHVQSQILHNSSPHIQFVTIPATECSEVIQVSHHPSDITVLSTEGLQPINTNSALPEPSDLLSSSNVVENETKTHETTDLNSQPIISSSCASSSTHSVASSVNSVGLLGPLTLASVNEHPHIMTQEYLNILQGKRNVEL